MIISWPLPKLPVVGKKATIPSQYHQNRGFYTSPNTTSNSEIDGKQGNDQSKIIKSNSVVKFRYIAIIFEFFELQNKNYAIISSLFVVGKNTWEIFFKISQPYNLKILLNWIKILTFYFKIVFRISKKLLTISGNKGAKNTCKY